MLLTDNDLRQISSEYLKSLSSTEVVRVAVKLLNDLKDARDRLNQNPNNSSRPPSSQEPWVTTKLEGESESNTEDESATDSEPEAEASPDENSSGDDAKTQDKSSEEDTRKTTQKKQSVRKAGKQEGSPGFGRTQKLPLTREEVHRAISCAACDAVLTAESDFVAVTGHYVIDIERGDKENLGIRLTNIKHIYGDTVCDCGHMTRTMPHRCPDEDGWNVGLSQWRLVGPDLMSLIICLALRMRLSRERIKEFLHDWLGLDLSKGTINQCVHEGGRAVEPVEEQLIEEIVNSNLLHADETSWKESGVLLWLWVFTNMTVTLYMIGNRSKGVIDGLLGKKFSGWLMSDGYRVYRSYMKRLRCWAHLIRKARGLKESVNNEASIFGSKALFLLETLKKAIYQARESPGVNLEEKYNNLLDEFRSLCEQYKDAVHGKTSALAGEFLNDWEAIFRVLKYPHLPLTNNEAEQALRHWVIARKLSYGTRTKQGSRAFSLLASVVETCRKRNVSPWTYLAEVITVRRSGGIVPPIPAVG